jgi:hypothetical protein
VGRAGRQAEAALPRVDPVVGVAVRAIEGDVHAADGIDEPADTAEADQRVVVDLDRERPTDGTLDPLLAVAVPRLEVLEELVDLRLVVAPGRQGEAPRVARDAERGGVAGHGVDRDDHHGVRPVARVGRAIVGAEEEDREAAVGPEEGVRTARRGDRSGAWRWRRARAGRGTGGRCRGRAGPGRDNRRTRARQRNEDGDARDAGDDEDEEPGRGPETAAQGETLPGGTKRSHEPHPTDHDLTERP